MSATRLIAIQESDALKDASPAENDGTKKQVQSVLTGQTRGLRRGVRGERAPQSAARRRARSLAP